MIVLGVFSPFPVRTTTVLSSGCGDFCLSVFAKAAKATAELGSTKKPFLTSSLKAWSVSFSLTMTDSPLAFLSCCVMMFSSGGLVLTSASAIELIFSGGLYGVFLMRWYSGETCWVWQAIIRGNFLMMLESTRCLNPLSIPSSRVPAETGM